MTHGLTFRPTALQVDAIAGAIVGAVAFHLIGGAPVALIGAIIGAMGVVIVLKSRKQ